VHRFLRADAFVECFLGRIQLAHDE
jgi:hypothetical protein